MNIFSPERPNTTVQKLDNKTVHDWYRFVLSYPDHLVRDLLDHLDVRPGDTVLDPFVGTGTTLIECKKRGVHSIGLDTNPFTAFASRVKTNWDIDLMRFDQRVEIVLNMARPSIFALNGAYSRQLSFDDVLPHGHVLADGDVITVDDSEIKAVLPKNWIGDRPLQKCLILKHILNSVMQDEITDLCYLALAKTCVAVSNLGFGPEVYVKRQREDADVFRLFSEQIRKIRHDLHEIQKVAPIGNCSVFHHDARQLSDVVYQPIPFVISSPPYPNEKDYTRTTRLELILLDFMQNKADLRTIKKKMLRSHTRNIYVADQDSQFVDDIPEIKEVSHQIEQRRIELGKTSGFERLYHRVVTEYFGGMYRVLEQIERCQPKGGKVALVVGDQMSYFRIPIYTARWLSLIACRKLNYREVETLLWRTRKSTVTKMDVEEHILILEKM